VPWRKVSRSIVQELELELGNVKRHLSVFFNNLRWVAEQINSAAVGTTEAGLADGFTLR
jgi:hypothetical protein